MTTQKCFGCSACASVCAAGAIQMKPDSAGFLYPQIDSVKCIGCGRCREVCPVDMPLMQTPNTFYGLKANGEKRLESTSGGAFRLLAEQIVAESGVVFGCLFDGNWHLVYSAADDSQGIQSLLGTKYVQADPGESFETAKNLIGFGRKVLFFGNPCTIHGLRLYIKAIFGSLPDNLLLIDHICYGVPSPKFWEQYTQYLERIHAGQLSSFEFRSKTSPDSGHTVRFSIKKDGKTEVHTTGFSKDPYLRIFNKNISLRESCLSCPYCSENRESDITLGDFWGIEKTNPAFDDGYGVSLVITHSEKGEKWLKKVLSNSDYFVSDADNASQPRLHECGKATILRKLFINDMERSSMSGFDMELMLKKYGA